MQKIRKRLFQLLIALLVIYGLLLIPDFTVGKIIKAGEKPFAWNKDQLWDQQEKDFRKAKQQNKHSIDSTISLLFDKGNQQLSYVEDSSVAAADSSFGKLLTSFFSLATLVAVQQNQQDSFINYYNKVRGAIKMQSKYWDTNDKQVRNTIYQLLYGMRAATEEVLLQSGSLAFNPAMMVKEEKSATPFTNIFGIEVHSGDLLVSRGGAEVSALISRGNDYPGNFSHVALIYVDDKNIPFLIEAHIEKGVAVSSVEQYTKDKKLRFMVLRPRADIPQLVADPMLPQKAAKLAYDEAMTRHIPYDFKMNFKDSSALFCSEVGSYAYRKNGIRLWQGLSTISSQGVVNWLQAFGVENFVTQMPSDLEYDSQLSIVAEWRDPETLYKDHIDNAVMDALLEQADKGKAIEYNHWQLPFVRCVKAWCMIKNQFGGIGIIPEGMSATQALRNQYFVALYNEVRMETTVRCNQFIKENNYKPPYWQMLALSREAYKKVEQG